MRTSSIEEDIKTSHKSFVQEVSPIDIAIEQVVTLIETVNDHVESSVEWTRPSQGPPRRRHCSSGGPGVEGGHQRPRQAAFQVECHQCPAPER
jgi:hypothetical protein